MAKQQTDDELNLRRKARRRLIGAIALTLAVVVILPMVLDREPNTTGKDIDLSIPDPDKAGAFVPRIAIPESVQPSASSSVASLPTAPVKVNETAKPPVELARAKPAVVVTTVQKAAIKQGSVEGFVAQIGAYANADTAKQELKKLKKWGFRAYTEKSGDTTRVRVGPYPDRDKAEKAARQLEKHGLHPVIVSNK